MHKTQDEDKIKTNKTQNIAQKTKTTMSNSEKLATLGTQDKGWIQTTQKTKTTMSNSEKLATLGTQNKGRIQTTQKTKTHPTKNRWGEFVSPII